jgi:hypothetical protein
VIQLAKEGKTTLFKAIELLEFTLSAFHYARWLGRNRFDLSRESGEDLRESDNSFQEMLNARLNAKMPLVGRCEKACLDHLESALEKAESDCHDLAGKMEEEGTELESVGKLEDLKEEVKDSISDEIHELEMIKDQCSRDSRKIGKGGERGRKRECERERRVDGRWEKRDREEWGVESCEVRWGGWRDEGGRGGR